MAKAVSEAIAELDAAKLAEAVADGVENVAAIISTTIECLTDSITQIATTGRVSKVTLVATITRN